MEELRLFKMRCGEALMFYSLGRNQARLEDVKLKFKLSSLNKPIIYLLRNSEKSETQLICSRI